MWQTFYKIKSLLLLRSALYLQLASDISAVILLLGIINLIHFFENQS